MHVYIIHYTPHKTSLISVKKKKKSKTYELLYKINENIGSSAYHHTVSKTFGNEKTHTHTKTTTRTTNKQTKKLEMTLNLWF